MSVIGAAGLVALASAAPAALPQQSGAVDLLSQANVQFDGAAPNDLAGLSVAGAGDVNGDGRPDVLLGVNFAGNNGRAQSGSACVVFGKASTTTVDLAALGEGGFRIDGAAAQDRAGISVAGAGDVNGDARPDVLVGAYAADNNGRALSGSAYVVYGFGAPQLAYEPLIATAGRQVAPHAPTLLRRTGEPSLAVAPPLPTGLTLDPRTGVVSGTPTRPQPQTAYTVTLTDLAGSTTAQLPIRIEDTSAPELTLSGPTSQRVLKQRGVLLVAACDEPCTLTATGTITVARSKTVLRLGTSWKTLTAAGRTTLKLRLSSKALARVKRHLTERRRLTARVTVRAEDLSGNARTVNRTAVLRR